MVDRSAFDRIVEAGGFITADTGGAPDANLIPIPKPVADAAMDAAACIGCGACVAACPNSAAQLFTSAKVGHLNLLPQGQAERYSRAEAMVETMEEFFGSCTNHGECEEACPKEISIDFIAADEQGLPQGQVQEPPPTSAARRRRGRWLPRPRPPSRSLLGDVGPACGAPTVHRLPHMGALDGLRAVLACSAVLCYHGGFSWAGAGSSGSPRSSRCRAS